MSLKDVISKTSIANVTAGIIILGGVYIAYKSGDAQLISFIVGAAIGYLFPKSK